MSIHHQIRRHVLTLSRLDIFDEYTRRQYVAKAPQRNPFGTDETPNKFAEFDVFTKVRVLHQLSTWTLNNAERMRSLMEEKDNEQTQWVYIPPTCMCSPELTSKYSASRNLDGTLKIVLTTCWMTIDFTAAPMLPFLLRQSPNLNPNHASRVAPGPASVGSSKNRHSPARLKEMRRTLLKLM